MKHRFTQRESQGVGEAFMWEVILTDVLYCVSNAIQGLRIHMRTVMNRLGYLAHCLLIYTRTLGVSQCLHPNNIHWIELSVNLRRYRCSWQSESHEWCGCGLPIMSRIWATSLLPHSNNDVRYVRLTSRRELSRVARRNYYRRVRLVRCPAVCWAWVRISVPLVYLYLGA